MKLEDINKFRFKYDNTNVFATAYAYDSKDQKTANLIGDFYLDLDYDLDVEDSEKAFDVIRRDAITATTYLKAILGIDVSDIKYFFSGSKGLHIIVPKEVFGLKPDPFLHRHYKMLAEDIFAMSTGETIDLKIYDNRRLFRMPNSIHIKTGLYKVYLTYTEVKTLSFEDIKKIAELPRLIPKKEYRVSAPANMAIRNYLKKFEEILNRPRATGSSNLNMDYIPPCVQHIFDSEVPKGQRNDTAAFLASFIKQGGVSLEDAKERMYLWNEERCEPRMSVSEIDITVNSIYQGDTKVGCSKAKTISECDESNCKIASNRRKSKW